MLFPALASFLVKAALILGGALALRALLRDRLSAEARCRMLFLAAVLLPLAALVPALVPTQGGGGRAPGRLDGGILGFMEENVWYQTAAPDESLRIELPAALAAAAVCAWAAVSLFFLFRAICIRLILASRLSALPVCRDSVWNGTLADVRGRYGIKGRLRLLDGGAAAPFTAGLGGRTLVVPASDASWTGAKVEAALLHELAHVKRRDVPAMTILEILAAFLWCLPPSRWTLRALAEDREEACDALAIDKGARASEYASLILQLSASRGTIPLGASGIVGRTRTERRILQIVAPASRWDGNRFLRRVVLAGFLGIELIVGGSIDLSPVFAVEPGKRQDSAVFSTIKNGEGIGTAELPLAALPTCSPLTGEWRVTQPFGEHPHPITGKPYLHAGIDLSDGHEGAPVRSTIAGTVTEAGYEKERGNYVAIRDGDLTVRFMKLKRIQVVRGQRIGLGAEVGTVGATGAATGPHLHYEVWQGVTAVDPAILLKAGGAAYQGL